MRCDIADFSSDLQRETFSKQKSLFLSLENNSENSKKTIIRLNSQRKQQTDGNMNGY